MMAELAVRGVIDDVSLTVATVQNPDSFKSLEVLDGTGPYKKQRRQEFHLTKSVDRHQMNSDFVITSLDLYFQKRQQVEAADLVRKLVGERVERDDRVKTHRDQSIEHDLELKDQSEKVNVSVVSDLHQKRRLEITERL